ncbi:hypothetical protein JOM56_007130 [Amanita muscaria]
MGRRKNWRKASAANARAARWKHDNGNLNVNDDSDTADGIEAGSDVDECGWNGTVNHFTHSGDDTPDLSDEWEDSEGEDGLRLGEEGELEGEELVESLRRGLENELVVLEGCQNVDSESMMAYEKLKTAQITKQEWKAAEKKRGFGYTGNSLRTKQRHAQAAWKKESEDAVCRRRCVMKLKLQKNINESYGVVIENSKSADLMRAFLSKGRATTAVTPGPVEHDNAGCESYDAGDEIFTGYASDVSDDFLEDEWEDLADGNAAELTATNEVEFPVQQPPPLKRRRLLSVPYREARLKAQEMRRKELKEALVTIEKLIHSKKMGNFEGRHNSLQEYRARAIQTYLNMVVRNGRKGTHASECAAESQGFSAKWGAQLSFSFLSDPAIRAELRSFVRSNKWALSPEKLAAFSEEKMVGEAAKKYLQHIVDEEMPRGLKRYLDLELMPRIQMKVGKGVSLETARRWLHHEGFRFMEHKKGLYFDGHERPDVVDYRQNKFLPAFAAIRH